MMAILLNSCACANASFDKYEEPTAAAIQVEEDKFEIFFHGNRPMLCEVLDYEGKEAYQFMAIRSGSRMDLSFLSSGEYTIVIKDGIRIAGTKKISLR